MVVLTVALRKLCGLEQDMFLGPSLLYPPDSRYLANL